MTTTTPTTSTTMTTTVDTQFLMCFDIESVNKRGLCAVGYCFGKRLGKNYEIIQNGSIWFPFVLSDVDPFTKTDYLDRYEGLLEKYMRNSNEEFNSIKDKIASELHIPVDSVSIDNSEHRSMGRTLLIQKLINIIDDFHKSVPSTNVICNISDNPLYDLAEINNLIKDYRGDPLSHRATESGYAWGIGSIDVDDQYRVFLSDTRRWGFGKTLADAWNVHVPPNKYNHDPMYDSLHIFEEYCILKPFMDKNTNKVE